MPYLRRVDAARIYTNHGPLLTEFEARLAYHLALPSGGVVSASSGTAALIGSILSAAGDANPRKPLALMPAFTFVATAVAAERCGYEVFFADIDANTWMLDPEQLAKHPALARVGVVLPVAPFGRPVAQEPWLRFRAQTGIPVIIDGAACFDRLTAAPERYIGPIPVALSFHATKAFSVGEGGGVALTDSDLASRITQSLNFGFLSARNSETPSTNGKLSEYHAAVGLAELDGWTEKQVELTDVIERYRKCFGQYGLQDRFVGAPSIGLSYALFRCRDAVEGGHVQNMLERRRLGVRFWYGAGLHRQRHFVGSPRERLDVTDAILPYLLGLPMAPDLGEAQIARVIGTLAAGLDIAGGERRSADGCNSLSDQAQ
jgi:dTDP-4-amino-4,6-dideoxygalactose transaminase